MDFFVELSHGALEFVSKFVEDFLVPLIIFVVDILLDSAIVDDDCSEILSVLRSVKSFSSGSDLVEKLSPLFDIFAKHVIDLDALQIPQRLILFPNSKVLVRPFQNILKGFISFSDVVVLHLLDQTHVGFFPLAILALELTISLSLHSLESTDDFDLIVELSVQASSRLGKRRIEDECLILHLDLHYKSLHY